MNWSFYSNTAHLAHVNPVRMLTFHPLRYHPVRLVETCQLF